MSTTAAPLSECPHGPRHGIVFCPRCRHEARVAARDRTRRRSALIAAGALVLAIVAAGSVASPPRAGVRVASAVPSARPNAKPQPPRPSVQATPATAIAAATPASEALPRPAAIEPPQAPPQPPPVVHTPTVPVGRTDLGEGMFAIRAGDTVTVHFDTPLARTRNPEKFERVVRATLPRVYGATLDSILQAVPAGYVAAAGSLLRELPERGVQLPLAGASTLSVWPVTRPGEDGPLVVRYRVLITR